MTTPDSRPRLQALFRDLFQLDYADLDFGLYRLFYLKKAEVETFLNKQLPAEIDRAFEAVAGVEREALLKRVDELAVRAQASIADDAILPSGEPNPVHAGAKVVKEYSEARKRLRAVEVSEVQRAEVFNLLYAFFSRYYDAGDFIPRRAYRARASYAVPYNGEEVVFHWANKDQHYIKTSEALRDYAFTVSTVSGLYRVRFTLEAATTAKDNTKGDIRYFFPVVKGVTFDHASGTLAVPFHYRLPTETEAARYGANWKAQEAILDEAEPKVLEAVNEPTLRGGLSQPSPSGKGEAGEEQRSLLRRRLRHFTRKNTTDYFIHKNLSAFLRQELDFFIRDQVVHEADLEGDFGSKRSLVRVFRTLAMTVIAFLAQIEDSQKRLFEKRKFVLRTDYLVPIQRLRRELWPEVLRNKAQLAEWKALFAIKPESTLFNVKGQVNEHILDQHPTLVVNTTHFDKAFRDGLLDSYDDLDAEIDGILVHADNYHGLRILATRFARSLPCVYIDPPYNAATSEILYKNAYKHSSWLSFIEGRLKLARELMGRDGSLVVAIDENEQERLGLLLAEMFPEHDRTCVSIVHNPRGIQGTNFSYCHDFAYFVFPKGGAYISAREIPEAEWEYANLRNWGGESERHFARSCFYPIFVRDGKIVRLGEVPPEDFHPKARVIRHRNGELEVWPIDKNGVERKWRYAHQSLAERLRTTKVVGERDDVEIHIARIHDRPKTVWTDKRYDNGVYGSRLLKDILGTEFSFPKSVHTVRDCIVAVCASQDDGFTLDFFAGSGTTGHAVILANRETGRHGRFILVEMGEYFDTALVPRIQKVMFAPEWKDGKPARLPTKEEAERTPRLVKILRLESYEDALHNTFSDKAIERLTEREKAYWDAVGDEEYRIRYLVKLPLEASDSMLNLAKLEHPFDYTMAVLTDHGPETQTVDLVETFNWLYGLRVRRVLSLVNETDTGGKETCGRSYRAIVASDRDGRKRVLVVWRDMTGLDASVERPFLEAQAKELGPFEEQWINGDSAAKGFASLDGLFKRLTEEGER